MFNLFRRKPKFTGQQILEELGEFSQRIVSAADEPNDTMVGLMGAAVVAVIIRESSRCYGITIKDETIFARFVNAIQDQDSATMAEMTKEMASALKQVDGTLQRGGLIYFWFKGNSLGS